MIKRLFSVSSDTKNNDGQNFSEKYTQDQTDLIEKIDSLKSWTA